MKSGLKILRTSLLPISILLILWAFSSTSNNRYFEIAKSLELYSDVYKQVNDFYVDEINPDILMETGLKGMLNSLDPYTTYIPIERVVEASQAQGEQYAGIGATVIYKGGKTIVDMIPKDSQAARRGLQTGDIIEEVESINISGMDPEDIERILKGQANTNVTLTLRKFGDVEPVKITVPRTRLERKNVSTFLMLPGDIGYIKLSIFSFKAAREVRNAVIDLKGKGAKGIILDLRGNGGGLLNEAISIVNIFVPRGNEVVTTRGKIVENNRTYSTLQSATDTEIPLLVLVNSRSASASEIVAGTLQDYDRAVILGTKSFGKGLVQGFFPLSYNAQLKVTTAKYYTPSGRCIQALDYSNRQSDGSVGKVPDSLKQKFFTRNNRVVYDGGGVDPDVLKPGEIMPPILKSLTRDLIIFDFATSFRNENDSIPGPREFEVDDPLMSEFRNYISQRGFKYSTQLESEIESLKEIAEQEKYLDYINQSMNSLGDQLLDLKGNDYERHRELIRKELQKEIIQRYYFETGVVESTLDNDHWIDESIEILNNHERYKSILGF